MSERITVTVKRGTDRAVRLSHSKERALSDTLREGGITLPSLCGVTGKCGRCTVRFLSGAPLPTWADREWIAPEMLRQGYRLACLTRPLSDCVLETSFREEEKLSVLTEGYTEAGAFGSGKRAGRRTALAADIGTTTIAMELIDTDSGYVWDTFTCLNPQRSYGTDVISRIRAGSGEGAGKLKALVRRALEEGTGALVRFARENELCKPDLLVAAANTVMGHLLMGYSVEGLGKSPFTPENTGWATCALGGIRTVLMPGSSAFVGGDIVSGLYACGLGRDSLNNGKNTWLFMDLGTNAEMALGRGGRIFSTAAAAGPAFEGSARMEETPDAVRKNGTGQRKGTGAERILILSKLLEQKKVDATGLLGEPWFENGIMVDGTLITQKDIREIQLAKAAVRAGICFLKEKAGISDDGQIDRVYLSGGFGFCLDTKAAVRIGLIPGELEDRLILSGNTSLAGAARYAAMAENGQPPETAGREKAAVDGIVSRMESFNLADQPDFEQQYVSFIDFV